MYLFYLSNSFFHLNYSLRYTTIPFSFLCSSYYSILSISLSLSIFYMYYLYVVFISSITILASIIYPCLSSYSVSHSRSFFCCSVFSMLSFFCVLLILFSTYLLTLSTSLAYSFASLSIASSLVFH